MFRCTFACTTSLNFFFTYKNALYYTYSVISVDGGHRSIIFSRIGGVQKNIYPEGLHFRVPWFQYPIIFDIRAKPKKLTSPTGSKGIHHT